LKYKCGHESEPVFLSGKTIMLSYPAYLVWKESTGYEGDKSQCWACFCKEMNGKWKKKQEKQ